MKAVILAMSMFLAASISFASTQDEKAPAETKTEQKAGEKKACCAPKSDTKANCANMTEAEKTACAKENDKKACPTTKKTAKKSAK